MTHEDWSLLLGTFGLILVALVWMYVRAGMRSDREALIARMVQRNRALRHDEWVLQMRVRFLQDQKEAQR